MKTIETINFDQFRSDDVKAFRGDRHGRKARLLSGRPDGEQARVKVELSELDGKLLADPGAQVVFEIPGDITLISSSFLLGLIGDSVRELGVERFQTQYKFEGRISSHYLNRAVRRAGNRASALAQPA